MVCVCVCVCVCEEGCLVGGRVGRGVCVCVRGGGGEEVCVRGGVPGGWVRGERRGVCEGGG